MTAEIEQAARYVNPATGEALTLASSDNELARLVDDLRAYKREVDAAIKEVSRELLSRMDKAAKWTVHAGEGIRITGTSPRAEEKFDAPALRDALEEFVDSGVLSIGAVDAAVEIVVSYKPHARGISALRALGGEVEEVVDAWASQVERDRYISVSRNG